MQISHVFTARAAVVLMFATLGLAACDIPNPTVTNPGLQQDRAGKYDEKDSSTKSQNPTRPVGQ